MSPLLHFSAHTLQEVALAFMGLVYTTRLFWLFRRFKAGRERQMATGTGTSKAQGVMYSLAIIGMPWAMESTRKKWFLYLQFMLFHLAVVAAIALSFLIPYWPATLTNLVTAQILQAAIGAGFVVGCLRILRRVGNKHIRAISSPDDFFSLVLLTVWFFFAFFSVQNSLAEGETVLITYFVLTAFFLVYVPFSKISHYLYYPITRYYFGKSMGHRGVFPMPRAPRAQPVAAEPSGQKVPETTY